MQSEREVVRDGLGVGASLESINWRAFVTALENSHYAGPVEHRAGKG